LRPGHNFCAVSTALDPIYSHYEKRDLIVALDERSYLKHKHEVLEDCIMVYNSGLVKDGDPSHIGIPLTTFVDRIGKTKDEAVELSTVSDKIPLGIFYKEDKPVYHELVLEGKNLFTGSLTKEERVKRIKELLKI